MEGVHGKLHFIPLQTSLHPVGQRQPPSLPKEEERNQALIHGAIDPEIITWIDPEPRLKIKTVCIQSVSMQNIQEQLLLTISAENFSDSTNLDKLNLLAKEREIQEIMKNTQVDKDNNKVQVNYLYKETLENLGENYFGATQRTQMLHSKVYTQPKVPLEMDKYIHRGTDEQQQLHTG